MEIVKRVSVTLLPTLFILSWIYLQERLLPCLLLARPWSSPHAWVVVRIPKHIGLVVSIFTPSRDQSKYRHVGLMNFAALPSLQRTARKASRTRRRFPWKNPKATSLLRVGLPVFGPYSSSSRPTLVSWLHAHIRAVVFHTLHRDQRDTKIYPLVS